MPVTLINNNLEVVERKAQEPTTIAGRHANERAARVERNAAYNESKGRKPYGTKPKLIDVSGEPKLMLVSSDQPIETDVDTGNYFLDGLVAAYNSHEGLRLTPDDILQCVSLAVSQCVCDHAEELREVFVNHEGKKKLVIKASTPPGQFDWSMLTGMMSKKIDENIKTSLGLEPKFSTTTRVTRTAGDLTKMTTFKEYFSYGMMLSCGIRSVDLAGTLEDWQQLRAQIANAAETFASKNLMVNWFKHVITIVDRMIATYECDLITPELEEFWSRIVNRVRYGSGGQSWVSGWSRVLVPGSNYNKFPAVLNVLTDQPVPKPTKGCYGFQDVEKAWWQLCGNPSGSTVDVNVELNDHGLVYDLVNTVGHVGYSYADGYFAPVIGYYTTAAILKKPVVTDEAEVVQDPFNAYTVATVDMRKEDLPKYLAAAKNNLDHIIADQTAQLTE